MRNFPEEGRTSYKDPRQAGEASPSWGPYSAADHIACPFPGYSGDQQTKRGTQRMSTVGLQRFRWGLQAWCGKRHQGEYGSKTGDSWTGSCLDSAALPHTIGRHNSTFG